MTKEFSSDPYDHDMIRVKTNRNGMDEFIPAPKELSDAMDIVFADDGDNDPLRKLNPNEIQQIRWRVLNAVYPVFMNAKDMSWLSEALNSGDGTYKP